MSATETTDFENARKRLEEIVGEVRSKDLPLEKSLDLYEEAIKLGTTCSQLVDKAAFSADEHGALQDVIAEQSADMPQTQEGEGAKTAFEASGASEAHTDASQDDSDAQESDGFGQEAEA